MSGWRKLQNWVAPTLDEEQRKRFETKLCPSCGRQYEAFFVRCPSDQMTLSEIPPPKGRLGKRYECKAKIGAGSLFDVYEGTNTESEEKVVVKVLRREFECDQRAMKHFEQEQMIASALKHEHIAQILAFGALPDQYLLQPFIVTGYLDWINLGEALAQWGACDNKTAPKLMTQICDAFEFAHKMGGVHTDFKPSNVFVSAGKSPAVKIVDFGVSKRLFGGREDTRYGAGSTAQSYTSALYTAPEVNKGAAPNALSDIYAVGCVFYELLSGKPPFPGTNAFELAYSHEHDEVPPLPEAVGSETFRQTLIKCLAKDPASRLSNISELKPGVTA
jgi:serine/threonine-protein kinase